jgi:uncharacterized protein (TIGR02996 family)
MTDREALYRAILEHPDDDTPRLIYADALEDEGHGKLAAFVRAQVEVARLAEYDSRAIRHRHHAQELVAEANRWLLEQPGLPDGLQWVQEPFRRGLPAAVEAKDGAAFLAHADELFNRYPIESVEFAAIRVAEVGSLAESPWLTRLTRLGFPAGLSGQVAPRLLNSPNLTRLTELYVGPGMTVRTAARALVHSQAFRRLTSLSWRDDQRSGGAVLAELIQLADPPRLKKLDLSGNRITADAVGRLAAAPALAAVEDLDLSGNTLGPDGVRALIDAAFFPDRLPRLRSLHLLHTRPETDGVRALTATAFFPELQSLSLGGNNLGPAAAKLIADSPAVGSLRVLDLRENRLGDRGAAALAASRHLHNLMQLDLAENQIGEAGAAAIAESAALDGVIYLNLYGNPFSPAAADRLKDRFADRMAL